MSLIRQPEPLRAQHEVDSFSCGEEVLDEWLQRRALKNEALGASRTFVACVEQRVVGYYALAAGSLTHAMVSSKVRRNMPEPIPTVVLARLAIDKDWQGQGLGYSLLQDALLRCHAAAGYIGARVLLVHALTDDAKRFYEHFGFRASPIDERMLMLLLNEITEI